MNSGISKTTGNRTEEEHGLNCEGWGGGSVRVVKPKQGVKLLFKFLSLIKGKNHTCCCVCVPRQHYNHDVILSSPKRNMCEVSLQWLGVFENTCQEMC